MSKCSHSIITTPIQTGFLKEFCVHICTICGKTKEEIELQAENEALKAEVEKLKAYKAKDLLDEIHTSYMNYHAKNYDTKDFVINLASGSVVVLDKKGYEQLQARQIKGRCGDCRYCGANYCKVTDCKIKKDGYCSEFEPKQYGQGVSV